MSIGEYSNVGTMGGGYQNVTGTISFPTPTYLNGTFNIPLPPPPPPQTISVPHAVSVYPECIPEQTMFVWFILASIQGQRANSSEKDAKEIALQAHKDATAMVDTMKQIQAVTQALIHDQKQGQEALSAWVTLPSQNAGASTLGVPAGMSLPVIR